MRKQVIFITVLSLAITGGMTAFVTPVMASVTQTKTVKVKGVVVDENNEPLIGATVAVKGAKSGAITDLDGNFVIDAPADAVLTVSYVGYQTREFAVKGREDLGQLKMNSDQTMLEQVVVVGYGTQKKADLTGSVAVVNADELKRVSNSNISSMLEGKVAGVQITSDGQPGADPTVRIRGIGSFGSTAPLYVVDGVPVGTTIRDFSPNDIETIQVLKDASAGAIYGSRAANGVIIITTKSGKKEQPLKVDYKGYFGWDWIPKNEYDVMNADQYSQHLGMASLNSGTPLPGGYKLGEDGLFHFVDGTNTKWVDEVFKTGTRQNHNINLSGGGKNNTYNIGLDYFKQKGTMEGAGPNFDRFTARVNNTMETKFIKFRTSLVYSHSKQDGMGLSNANEWVDGLYSSAVPVLMSATTLQPTIKAYDESTWWLDDKVGAASNYRYDAYGYGVYYDDLHGDISASNPLLLNNLMTRNTIVDRILLTGSAEVDLFKMIGHEMKNHKLTYKLNLSYNKTNAKDKTWISAWIQSRRVYLDKSNETLNEGYRSYSDALIENFLTYEGTMGRHHLNLVAGQTFEREKYHTLTGRGNNMPEPYYLQVGNAAERDASSYESEHVLASYIGRLTYDYDGRYLLQATVRRDGSSRLSSADRWDWFPSFSAGWRIDKEPFFQVDPNLVSLFKLRASYGILGNENIGEYQYMDTMARGNYTYSFGGNKVTGSSISNYVNTAIHWEKKKTLDIGLDYAMFGGALEFNVDYYNALSEDLLYSVPVPAEAGATNESVTMNAASMRNTGLELSAAYRNYQNDFKYEFSGNVTLPKNTVVSLGPSGEARNDAFTRTELGAEVGRFYGYVYEGIFQNQEQIDNRVNEKGNRVIQNGAQPGDVAYKDINNDGQVTADDQDFIGSGMPKVQFGLSARFEYKGFDLSISTFGAAGYQLLDFVDMTLRSSYGMTNRSVDLMNAWTVDNPSTTVPRVYYKSTGTITNDMFSSRYLQNGAYWKIANVEFGYNLPEGIFGENGFVRSARIYVSGQNLYTLSKYRGYNIDFAGGAFTPGYNYCSYPAPVTGMLGVKLSF